jgi:hypothetical protein
MAASTDTDLFARKTTAMSEWADTLTRAAHDTLDRMSTTLTLTETKIALVRELIARREGESHPAGN